MNTLEQHESPSATLYTNQTLGNPAADTTADKGHENMDATIPTNIAQTIKAAFGGQPDIKVQSPSRVYLDHGNIRIVVKVLKPKAPKLTKEAKAEAKAAKVKAAKEVAKDVADLKAIGAVEKPAEKAKATKKKKARAKKVAEHVEAVVNPHG